MIPPLPKFEDCRGILPSRYRAHEKLPRRYDSASAVPLRKAGLAQLLLHPVDGIFVAEHEQGEIGDFLFSITCNMGSEGILSKHFVAPTAPAESLAHATYSRVKDTIIASPFRSR